VSSTFAKLNLRPQERRLVVFVGIVLFVVLNLWFVWPHFGDWATLQGKRLRAERNLATYQAEIARQSGYRVKLRELESAGSTVLPEEQALDLVRIVNEQSSRNRLMVARADPRPRISTTQTNRFFEEQYVTINVNTGNEELVNFLVSLTSTNSLIRVRDMTLRAEPSGFKLVGDITLVASYQRTSPAGSSASTNSRPTATAATASASSRGARAADQPASKVPPPTNQVVVTSGKR
jgi:Tfp pilus assembly protein PilO